MLLYPVVQGRRAEFLRAILKVGSPMRVGFMQASLISLQ